MQIVGLTLLIEPIGPSERPRIGPLALATLLAHLAIACPAQAETPAAETGGVHVTQSADSAPASDAKAVTADTDQGLQKPTDLRSLCQTIASAAAQNGLPFEFFSRIIWQESRFNSGAIGP
jgi:soluble lytic murein transglycosylase-like protein